MMPLASNPEIDSLLRLVERENLFEFRNVDILVKHEV
jgi:hypothetical protein